MSNAAKAEAETFHVGERATGKASELGWCDESSPAACADWGVCPTSLDQLNVKENVTFSIKIQLITSFFRYRSGHGVGLSSCVNGSSKGQSVQHLLESEFCREDFPV